MSDSKELNGAEIAIIGMACRFPGARDLNQYWENLLAANNTIMHFTPQELRDAGISDSILDNPHYIRAKGVIDDAMSFDNAFFGYSEREAIIMDPQLRVYHECAWHAVEDAGYANRLENTLTGIYGGASLNPLWGSQFEQYAKQGGAVAYEALNLINRDFFNSRIAYLLGISGPAVTVQTACSTGLVAVHQAIQGILSGDCDMALAGSVSISTNPDLAKPDWQGYLYQEGMILSPDGACRPFDATAKGTVLSDGVGFVLLKRYDDAVRDGDRIYALIKGSAINNDGNNKVGFTAPSIQGQQEVIKAAISIAGVETDAVSYVEAHGTGTSLGDPIELKALQHSYRFDSHKPLYIGSVKSNLGHTDTAAGMAGLIKVAMSVYHKTLPPMLNYDKPNEKCSGLGDVIQPVIKSIPWRQEGPLTAGVSSFGIGGTNAHLLVQEAPSPENNTSQSNTNITVLPVFAPDPNALSRNLNTLAEFVSKTNTPRADIFYTLLHKRPIDKVFGALVLGDAGSSVKKIFGRQQVEKVHFMFSGQGTQFNGMAGDLYEQFPYFRSQIDKCLAIAEHHIDAPLRPLLLNKQGIEGWDIHRTDIAQMCLFIYEYSLALFLMHLGIKPSGLIGHSLGEYTAACVAGVFTIEQGIRLIYERGSLMASTQQGSMVAVFAKLPQLPITLASTLAIAAHNGEQNFVVSGCSDEVEAFCQTLESLSVSYMPIQTSGAFHSPLMEPILGDFRQVLSRFAFSKNNIPIVSNVTGDWLRTEQVCDPAYWVSHLRNQVEFDAGIRKLLDSDNSIMLEIGPRSALKKLLESRSDIPQQNVIAMAGGAPKVHGTTAFSEALATIHCAGISINWKNCFGEQGGATWLPPYAFARNVLPTPRAAASDIRNFDPKFFTETWKKIALRDLPREDTEEDNSVMLILSPARFSDEVVSAFLKQGQNCVIATFAEIFQQLSDNEFTLGKNLASDMMVLMSAVRGSGSKIKKILYLPTYLQEGNLTKDYLNLVAFSKSIAEQGLTEDLDVYCAVAGIAQPLGYEELDANVALLSGPIRVLQQENEYINSYVVDIQAAQLSEHWNALCTVCLSKDNSFLTAVRGRYAWQRTFEECIVKSSPNEPMICFKRRGVYLLTGGFGGIGSEFALFLARQYSARLVLCSRWAREHDPLLTAIRQSGGDVQTIRADFTHQGSFNDAMRQAEQVFGRVDGVLHTAGLPGETLMQRMSHETVSDVIRVKTVNAQDMVSAANSLDFVVFFSSVTGSIGGPGQAEYTAANAFLSVLAEQAVTKGIDNVFSIDWDAWKSVGMAYNAYNGGQKLIHHQVHSLLGDLVVAQPQLKCFKQRFTSVGQWVLHEHKVFGVDTAPGTTYLQMAQSGFKFLTGEDNVSIEKVYFFRPLSLEEHEEADVYTRFKSTDDNQFSFEIGSYHLHRKQWQIHAQGLIFPAIRAISPPNTLESLLESEPERHYDTIHGAGHLGMLAMPETFDPAVHEKLMQYGPRWNVFNQVSLFDTYGIASLELPESFVHEALPLHPAMLDCALSFYRPFLKEGVYIPVSVGSLQLFRPLPARLLSRAEVATKAKHTDDVISFDVDLYDEDGNLVATIIEFVMHKIEHRFEAPQSGAENPPPWYVSQYTELKEGLTPEFAFDVTQRILASGPNRIVVAGNNFLQRYSKSGFTEQAINTTLDVSGGELRPRPDISTPYAAPTSNTEKKVAAIWCNMLGLESVGINDDFFELGGNSLVLMQIHKLVQSQYSESLSVVELYDYPTIARLSERIECTHANTASQLLHNVETRSAKQKTAQRRLRDKRKDAQRLPEDHTHAV